ncbi:hypothetical protein EZZ75_00465 [Neisseria meningitidis]|nr:hypothetical protein [Neisseria meningitidis]
MRNVITVSVRKPKDLCRPNRLPAHSASSYSGLTKTSTAFTSPWRTICTVFGSPSCPDFNLIHYKMSTGQWWSECR